MEPLWPVHLAFTELSYAAAVARILVVDDDAHIRELVKVFLERDGFDVVEAADGAQALERLETLRADLAVVDVMMPHLDGWELTRQLHEASVCPVLLLTAKGETSQKIKGLQLGADDYLVKPFEPLELVARVRVLLRRYRIAASQEVSIGELVMNRTSHAVTAAGEDVVLPLKEFDLLFELASYAGQTRTRDQLIEGIWGYGYAGNERTLDVHINRLRERFPEGTLGFRIRTIRGLGYRLETAR